MRTKQYLIFLIFAGLVFCAPIAVNAQFSGGNGTSGNPYLISNVNDLYNVRNYLNAYFLQTTDINLNVSPYNTGEGWVPIGIDQVDSRFTGNYDGGDHTIFNLYINRPNTPNVGLFGALGIGGVIKNIGIEGVNVLGARGTGALVGRVRGNETNLIEYAWAFDGTVTGDGATGGLVGANNSVVELPGNRDEIPIISKSFADIDVFFSGKPSAGKDKFGGLVGCNQRGYTLNSFARGDVLTGSASGTERVGGLAGCADLRGVIASSYSTGQPTGTSLVGGLVGNLGSGGNGGTVEDSYWDIQTSNTSYSAGGNGLTTAQMMEQNNFIGFDFTNIWSIDPDINDGYPYLFNPNGLLPVSWLKFECKLQNGRTVLNWTTAAEWFNDYFIVERSTDLAHWVGLNQIQGSGTTDNPTHYSYTDQFPKKGKNFYRIRQVDKNGYFDFSPVVVVRNDSADKNDQWKIFPNPTSDYLTLLNKNREESISVQIFSASGKLMFQQKLDLANQLDLSSFPSGIYFLNIDDGKYTTSFIVK